MKLTNKDTFNEKTLDLIRKQLIKNLTTLVLQDIISAGDLANAIVYTIGAVSPSLTVDNLTADIRCY